MAHISGKDAKVLSGVTAITGAHNWTLDWNADILEKSDYQSQANKEFIAGNSGWTGTIEVNFDTGQNPHTDPPNLNPGESITFKFYVNTTLYYTGTALISSVSVAAPQADDVTYTVNFTGTGALDASNMAA